MKITASSTNVYIQAKDTSNPVYDADIYLLEKVRNEHNMFNHAYPMSELSKEHPRVHGIIGLLTIDELNAQFNVVPKPTV